MRQTDTTNILRRYWDRKIEAWARSVYGSEGLTGASERMMGHLRRSVSARMEAALELLRPRMAGLSIVDVGCGSGDLAALVMAAGAASYLGLDISPVALELGRKRAAEAGFSAERVVFREYVVGRDPLPASDVLVALGLLDWLDDAQAQAFIRELRGRRFVFSYSEQDNSMAEIAHRFYLVYRLWLVGGGVRARHHKQARIDAWLDEAQVGPRRRVRGQGMRFGVLTHNLERMS